MAKMVGYRELCEWIVYNDDISELEDDEVIPTVTMSAVMHLYDKDWDKLRKYLLKLKKSHDL